MVSFWEGAFLFLFPFAFDLRVVRGDVSHGGILFRVGFERLSPSDTPVGSRDDNREDDAEDDGPKTVVDITRSEDEYSINNVDLLRPVTYKMLTD